uniref:Uncharacterized protein n=1 Tax=Oreochromis aureus TaxID=47969 RepID=A0AAZ1XQ96_OREAU
ATNRPAHVLCNAVVICKQIPSAKLKCALTQSQYSAVYGYPSSSTYRWPEEASQRDVTLICVYTIPETLSRLGNVLYNCANKHIIIMSSSWYRLSLSRSPICLPSPQLAC